jgi:Tol biopolymer transport system component
MKGYLLTDNHQERVLRFSSDLDVIKSANVSERRIMKRGNLIKRAFIFGLLTSALLCVSAVRFSAQGKIAYTSYTGGGGEIYLMNSDGTQQINLTNDPAADYQPALSPDGSKIAFVSYRNNAPGIYIMNSDGTGMIPLTSGAYEYSHPSFSPDGSKILFQMKSSGPFDWDIYRINADGTNLAPVPYAANEFYDDIDPSFSPDGNKIVFCSNVTSNFPQVWIVDLSLPDPSAVQITNEFLPFYDPVFSPDGAKIALTLGDGTTTIAPEVMVMNLDGTNLVNLTNNPASDADPVFSPDGTKIAFTSARDGTSDIYVMSASGANQVPLTSSPLGSGNLYPSWSGSRTVNVDIPDDLAREQGSTLVVPINVTDTAAMGILSYDFALNFDPQVLEPLPVPIDKTGTLSAGFVVNAGTGQPGRVVVSGFGTTPLSGAGTLLYVKFSVIGTPPTASDLILNPFMFNEGVPPVQVSGGRVFVQGTIRGIVFYGTSPTTRGVPSVNISAIGTPNTSATTASDGTYVLGGFGPGSYTVTPSKTGDVNGITSLDASLVSQFLVGTTMLTSAQQTAGEVSGNGTLTSFDAALIAQYVVGLPNTGQTAMWHFMPASRSYLSVANLTAENYTAILLGEVSGNWTPTLGAALLGSVRTADLSLTPQGALTERRLPGTVTATLPSLKAKPGDVLTVGVGITAPGTPLLAYQFDVLYDASVLQLEATPVDVSATLSLGLTAVTNTLQPGRMRLAVYGASPITSGGTLINLKFRVVGAPGSNSTLAFDGLIFNEGIPAADGKNGKVTVRR